MTRSRGRKASAIPSHLPLIRDRLAEYERVALKEQLTSPRLKAGEEAGI